MVYRLACERIGVPPQEALAFDDASAGIEAARSAGMRCIGVASNGYSANLVMAGAERVITDFAGLEFDSIASFPIERPRNPVRNESPR
jgi:beta-phosphoglucomutase-like phosphatase (HAD superfamily)